MKYIWILIIFLLLPIAYASIILPPADAPFTVLPMILSSCSDYTKTKQSLCLEGDLNYIAVKWDVRYPDESERNVGVKCFLNCANPRDDIETNCASSQKCEYLGLVGQRSCTIPNPNYLINLPQGNVNNVTCMFYDPADPTIPFRPYPNRTFRPIDYSLSVSGITVNVGEQFNFPLSVIPLGLIPSTYTFNITEVSAPKALFIERSIASTEKLGYGDAGRFSPQMLFLVAPLTNARVEVLTTANSDPITCTTDAHCSYLTDGKCIIPTGQPNGKCWKRLEIQLKSGKASLPEFDAFGFLQIMLIAGVLLFVRRK